MNKVSLTHEAVSHYSTDNVSSWSGIGNISVVFYYFRKILGVNCIVLKDSFETGFGN
jgi:hypothetical protein